VPFFFQEVHISIDYDTGYFNLSQAKPGNGKPDLVAIESPKRPRDIPSNLPVPLGNFAGIGIGVGVFVIMVVFFLLAWIKNGGLSS